VIIDFRLCLGFPAVPNVVAPKPMVVLDGMQGRLPPKTL
jgi:hypothetical protein